MYGTLTAPKKSEPLKLCRNCAWPAGCNIATGKHQVWTWWSDPLTGSPSKNAEENTELTSLNSTITSSLSTQSTAPADQASQKDTQDMTSHSNTPTPYCRTDHLKMSLSPHVTDDWNSLPTETAMAKTLASFSGAARSTVFFPPCRCTYIYLSL